MTAGKSYDFIIAGGGSAACVAAMRLVRDFGFSVLIIERGPRDTARLMSFPAGYMKYLARDDFLEMHHTAPQPLLGGRGPIVPVAKALGGGSAVNAMVYMRGQKEDYDGWAAYLGNEREWSYGDMLPHFKDIEANSRFNDRYHGISGDLRVSEPRHISDTTEDFILAAQGLGHPYNPDFNGVRQNGVGIMQHTFAQWGRRIARSDARRRFSIRSRATPGLRSSRRRGSIVFLSKTAAPSASPTPAMARARGRRPTARCLSRPALTTAPS